MEENCQNCQFRGEKFMGPCFVPWCQKRDEPVSSPETESCPDFEKLRK